MTLPAPRLDSRSFAQLIEEARARIPRYTPEWTNFNESDPGMALVELHAWMTETILYELNRVPDLNYIKFLDLIGITPNPARPARTELAFTLDKLDRPTDALSVTIPMATRVAVDDPDIKQDISFETNRTLIAINADFGMVVAPHLRDALTRALVTGYDQGATWLHFFDPFGATPAPGACLYLGLVLRPKLAKDRALYVTDALPAIPLDLYADLVAVGDAQPGGVAVEGIPTHSCAAGGLAGPQIEWQIYTGPSEPAGWSDDSDSGWTRLGVTADGTGGLARSGHIVLELPVGATPVDPRRLPLGFWREFGQLKPPASFEELILVILDLEDVTRMDGLWARMGITDATVLSEIAACGNEPAQVAALLVDLPADALPDPKRIPAADWAAIDPDLATALPMDDVGYRHLYWVRAKYRADPEPGAPRPGRLRQLRLNTVPATQGLTRLEDRLGRSNGRPGQVFTLPAVPVLIDPASNAPDLALVVGGDPDWVRVDDFYDTTPDSRVYLLDPGSGRITFGDGLRGRIPVADAAILAARTRVGGGAIGNVGPGAIAKLKGQLRGVKSVTNFRAAHDGSDAETLDAVRLRAPHDLRHRDRAVSSDDFTDLAMTTPGVALHRVVPLPRRAIDADGNIVPRDGAVTLVLLPRVDRPKPAPTAAQFAAVCRWLEPRRLVTTELHLTGPTWIDITDISLTMRVSDGHDLAVVGGAVQDAIMAFLDPFTGGTDGGGWLFGEAIHHADLYDRILGIPGLRRVWDLKIVTPDHLDGNALTDRTPIADGALPFLSRDRIRLAVGYG